MTKFKYGRAKLTWDEIRQIEKDWKNDEGPARSDVEKLVKHIRFEAHQAEQNVSAERDEMALEHGHLCQRLRKVSESEVGGYAAHDFKLGWDAAMAAKNK